MWVTSESILYNQLEDIIRQGADITSGQAVQMLQLFCLL
jgi:hypothetical protein